MKPINSKYDAPVEALLNSLFPLLNSRILFDGWMTEAEAARKGPVPPLLIIAGEATGKSLLTKAIGLMLDIPNVLTITSRSVPTTTFNGYMQDYDLIVVDELKAGALNSGSDLHHWSGVALLEINRKGCNCITIRNKSIKVFLSNDKSILDGDFPTRHNMVVINTDAPALDPSIARDVAAYCEEEE